jgi:hypothetical protein
VGLLNLSYFRLQVPEALCAGLTWLAGNHTPICSKNRKNVIKRFDAPVITFRNTLIWKKILVKLISTSMNTIFHHLIHIPSIFVRKLKKNTSDSVLKPGRKKSVNLKCWGGTSYIWINTVGKTKTH